MRKVAIIGSGGAGKSTLARQLGAALGIEVIHLDAIFWKPGWTSTPIEEWKPIVENMTSRDSWIIDGNYGATLDIRLAAADTVVFLDYPRHICLYRAFKRRVLYNGKARPDMNPGCKEKIDWEFVKWIWNFSKRSRPSVLKKIELYAQNTNVIILKSPREADKFLASVNE